MPRSNMRDLSFATFNLLNLQVPGGITYDAGEPPLRDDAAGREAYDRKIRWTGERIRLLDAEVIAFQELWSREALEAAFAAAELTADYDLVARDAPGRGKPQVALAVRKNRHGDSQLLEGADWVAQFPDGFRFEKLRDERRCRGGDHDHDRHVFPSGTAGANPVRGPWPDAAAR